GDEIDWDALALAMREKAIGPGRLRGCRTSDTQPWADALDRLRGLIVKLVIGFFLWIADPEIEVGLIPHFEIPLRDFFKAVALHQMAREGFDHLAPAIPNLRRRHVLLVPEGVQSFRVGRELLGHEAHFHEGAHLIFQEAIVDLIDVREVVDGISSGIFVVHSDFILKNRVEPDEFEIGDAFGFAEIVTIALTQREDGASGTKHPLPEVGKGMRWSTRVDVDGFRDRLRCDGMRKRQYSAGRER